MLKYQEIANQIEEYIRVSKLEQGEKLPSLEDLITNYEVSKNTVIKALSILEKNGVIYQVRGSGIFVRRQNRKGYINLINNKGFTDDLAGFNLSANVLEVKTRLPTQEVSDNLKCSLTQEVYYVKRIRFINKQALCIEESYFNKEYVPYLNKEIVEDSIFHYLKETLKLKVRFSDKYLRIGQLNQTEASYLNLNTHDPALHVDELFYLMSGEPFDFSKMTYNYNHSQFFIQSSGMDK